MAKARWEKDAAAREQAVKAAALRKQKLEKEASDKIEAMQRMRQKAQEKQKAEAAVSFTTIHP